MADNGRNIMLENAKKLGITPNSTMADVIKEKSDRIGDKIYLTYVRDFDKGIDEKYTYKDMHLQSNKIGNGLIKLGVKKGEGIALFQINSPEFIFTLFGAFKIGSYIVLVNTGLKGDGLQFIIDHSDSKILVTHWSLIDRIMPIKSQLPKLKHILIDMNEAPEDFKLPEGIIPLQSVMDAPDDDIVLESAAKPEDIGIMIYTSGTTGLPKGTVFTYGRMLMGGALIWSALMFAALKSLNGAVFTCLPLFHGNALQLATMPSYLGEIPMVLSKRFSASRHWKICKKYNVITFNLLGSMGQYLLKQPIRPSDKEHRVVFVGSAATPGEIVREFEKRFNVKLSEGYGAVDGGGFSLGAQGQSPPVGSMGRPPTGVTAEVMDGEGNVIASPNTPGELVFLVKEEEREQRKVTYYKNKDASESRIKKGNDGQLWFHTGDVASKDENGWFFFVDRKKNSIRRKGENIAAYSVERIINQHEKVLESAAFGIKGSQIGEDYAEDEVMVTVVLKSGKSLTPEELLDFVKPKMAVFQIPRFIDFVKELPKSKVHRIMRRFLKERGVTESTYDREKSGYKI
ncbi:MAG: AMP-binding protein [Promethearchaeota archaeon]